MKTIRVGFSTHSSSFSWLIRTTTASRVSHTYVRIPVVEYSTSMIFQASGLLVNYCSGEIFDSRNTVFEEYDVEVSDEQYTFAEEFRVRQSGKPYSMAQIFGCLYVLGMRKFGFDVSNPFSDGFKSYVCVEIVTNMIGLPGGENMTPEDLRRWCADNARLVYQKLV